MTESNLGQHETRADRGDDSWQSSIQIMCPMCGYDLRGTDSQRCSECGEELDPVAMRELLREGVSTFRLGAILMLILCPPCGAAAMWCSIRAGRELSFGRIKLARQFGDRAFLFFLLGFFLLFMAVPVVSLIWFVSSRLF